MNVLSKQDEKVQTPKHSLSRGSELAPIDMRTQSLKSKSPKNNLFSVDDDNQTNLPDPKNIFQKEVHINRI